LQIGGSFSHKGMCSFKPNQGGGALSENFIPMDAAAIKRIPLGRFDEDFWAWTGEKHGLYSVQSAYRILVAEAQQEEDYSQNRSECSKANNS
jgi:hypothetical protein